MFSQVEGLGNKISGILRPSHYVIMFNFFSQLGVPQTSLDPSRIRDARMPCIEPGVIIIRSFFWTPVGNRVGY